MSDIKPRSYKPAANVLNHSYDVMFKEHPEAFDCIIWPAKDSSHNEIIADNQPVGTLLDRDERAQEYDPPVKARALIVPSIDLDFPSTSSGSFESFHGANEAITMLLSIEGLRTNTFVQWFEYLSMESDETVERTVYISEVEPMGRTLNAQMRYVCYPLPAMGEVPDTEPEEPEQPQEPEIEEGKKDDTPDVGVI